uniref:Uncharacterized protein n=1 Tax=Seriola lalandi dorsalis TaxID=1841481 RepID=A0A3B4X2B7_SERLL
VPCADAGNLAQSAVRLARQARAAPAGSDALVAVALGDANHVAHLVLRKDCVHRHLLLEHLRRKVNLGRQVAAVDLDLHQVRLLLAHLDLADLRVGEHAHALAVLLDALELRVDVLLPVGVLLDVVGEGLLLGAVPVLVEAALHLVVKVLRPHRRQRAQPLGRLDVPNHANHNHRRRLEHRHRLHNLLLVRLRARLVHIPKDVRHAGLVGKEGGQVRRLAAVVLREGLDLAAVAAGTLARQEAERAVADAS